VACAPHGARETIEVMKPSKKRVPVSQELQGMLVKVREELTGSEPVRAVWDETLVIAAVATARLNSDFSGELLGQFVIAEHEACAVLRAPRYVIEWLSEHGVYVVIGGEKDMDPVQLVEGDVVHRVLETAVVLWYPYEETGAYHSFADALDAARRLLVAEGQGV